MSDYSLDWYLVTTMPAQEMRAKTNMTLLGLTVWLPRYSKVSEQRGELRFVERMLFPGYLFLAFEPGREQWLTVRDAPGVYGVIAASGCPIRVDNEVVSTLMSGCLTGYFDQDKRRVGSKVRIVRGSHAEMVGRIVKAPDDEKLTVMLSGCGAIRFEQVSLGDVRLAELARGNMRVGRRDGNAA